MNQLYDKKHVLVIDHQPYWREFSTCVLRAAGFSAGALDNYNDSSLQDGVKGEDPDLIILGCVCVGPEEQELIAQLLNDKHHLLVLCTYLPEQVMRSLFLQGVDDIVDKPFHSAALIKTVHQAFENIVSREVISQWKEKVSHGQTRARSDCG